MSSIESDPGVSGASKETSASRGRPSSGTGHDSRWIARAPVIGSGLYLSAESAIECRKSVVIGNDVLISWDVLIMDSDWHTVMDENGTALNPDREIAIGNYVWIGARSTLLKGAAIC